MDCKLNKEHVSTSLTYGQELEIMKKFKLIRSKVSSLACNQPGGKGD